MAMIIHLIVGLIKKTFYKMSHYFPKPYRTFRRDINVKVDLSNYATKKDYTRRYLGLCIKNKCNYFKK